MKFFQVAAAALVGFSTLSVAAAAHATEIDFTDITELGGNPDGAPSWSVTVDGVVVTITPGPAGADLYWDSTDGFGVNGVGGGYEWDEIEGSETLTVSFSDTNGNAIEVQIDSFSVTDLFDEKQNNNNTIYAEVGQYTTDGVTHTFTSDTVLNPNNSNGTGTVLVGATDSTIVFTAPGTSIGGTYREGKKKLPKQDHEFSLAGISFTVLSVPELDTRAAGAASFLLAGIALVLCAPRRRRVAAEV